MTEGISNSLWEPGCSPFITWISGESFGDADETKGVRERICGILTSENTKDGIVFRTLRKQPQ